MKSIVRKLLVTGAVVASLFAFAQEDKEVMDVSNPAATHRWAGVQLYWANLTQKKKKKQCNIYTMMEIYIILWTMKHMSNYL